jgi:predicted nucleic acid-binding protein
MYLAGAPSQRKVDSIRLLEQLAVNRERMVTDAEVFQEILHRYISTNRRDAIQPAFDALRGVVDEVFPVDMAAVERAKELVFEYHRLSARDAIHLAVMEHHGIERILSFDSGFDGLSGITRIH